MMETVVHVLSGILIVGGSVFVLIGAYGLVRLPDVFTRIHAVSVSDTLGAWMLLSGMMLQAGFSFVTLKLVFIFCILVMTGPVATHALAQAAFHEGVKPVLDEDRRGRLDQPEGGAEAAQGDGEALADEGVR